METGTICIMCKVYFSEEDEARVIIRDYTETPFVLRVCKKCAFKIKDKIVGELQEIN